MTAFIQNLSFKLRNSNLFKDSFWAVFGNGTGNFLLLVAGIIIARLLGKDLYGEYGVVKTTMFQIAAFSTFGLGYTSTKFIAEYTSVNQSMLRSITHAALSISTISSLLLCALLFIFSHNLANFINTPQLYIAFRILGIIIVFRSLSTTGNGILGGYKKFRTIGINAIVSGIVMITLATPLTYFYSISGSLAALLASQFVLCVLNLISIWRLSKQLKNQRQDSFVLKLLSFSLPVAMKEFTYMLQAWCTSLFLARYTSIGEVGIYSAGTQWLAIVMFMPGLLNNIVMSYLSSETEPQSQKLMMRRMILINLVCSLLPFLVVFSLSGPITSMYGPTFHGLQAVLNICIFQSVFFCISTVLSSELIATGHNWIQFFVLSSRDIAIIIGVYTTLKLTHGINGALNISLLQLGIVIVETLIFFIIYKTLIKSYGKDNITNKHCNTNI